MYPIWRESEESNGFESGKCIKRQRQRQKSRSPLPLAAGMRENAHFPNKTKNCLKCFNTMPLGSVSYFTCIINYKAFTLKVVPGNCCVFFFFPYPSQNKTSASIHRPVFHHTSNIYLIIFFKKDEYKLLLRDHFHI